MVGQAKEPWKLKLDGRLNVYLVFIIFVFLLLSARLFFLQVVNAQEFARQSAQNSIRLIPIEARRGDILDSKGRVLATSQPVYVITFSPVPNTDTDTVIRRLAELLGDPELTAEAIWEKIKNNPYRYEPAVIKRFPSSPEAMAVITRLEERRLELPGVNISVEPQRFYPHGSLAGHILGFVGQITREELLERQGSNYRLNDKIGKSGIERYLEYEKEGSLEFGLKGKDGAEQVEVNAFNRKIRDLLTIPPAPGDTVELTIDLDLQKTLEAAMDQVIAEEKKKNPKAGAGAAVVLDVKTGAILAMASKPDMDPNDFVNGGYAKKQAYYNDEHLKPLFNRAVQGTYPPGSTFKPITALAALLSGAVRPQDAIYCSGRYFKPGGLDCWQSHGRVDLERALAVSCNTYFQWAGEMAGIKMIDSVAEQFGLGSSTGALGVLGEAKGILPSPTWKKEVNTAILQRWLEKRQADIEKKYAELLASASPTQRERLLKQKEQELRQLRATYEITFNFETTWQPFDTYNTAIGQGANSFTILQLANYVATLANGGTRLRPFLVKRVISPDGQVKKEYQPEVIRKVDIPSEILEEVRRGMLMVTQSPEGTASFLFQDFPPSIKVAAKTGTAQTGLAGDDKSRDFYGLFIAFAPYDDPQIAFAGVIEYARHGGDSAGKVAREVFARYFGLPSGMTSSVGARAVE
ncbi:peptidoglycan glycosyltransferase [Thermanaeromonas toyohensis ToBE]|uniref:Peptidoglycan glycosyltransferase n=1 Tax=Thermanaeromonas toyohensis ToBE TaxID=698762 RepID=A0A1W1VH18_9FIRM|nr:penicillin-binding protein 2 [Thermanaeromonas toyohensis]SMB92642.1 peptidoglycan glycosyltransferase [Thermanaeromonas toyohensis ToBE]